MAKVFIKMFFYLNLIQFLKADLIIYVWFNLCK